MAELISEFARRYENRLTREQYVSDLTKLFASAHCVSPRHLSEADVLAWCAGNGSKLANNTVRTRLARVCTFLRWCVRSAEADAALVESLMGRDNPLRNLPRLYGKVQGKNPARFLTYEQAYGQLLGTCDDTWLGNRDALVIRLGLSGLRVSEIIHLRIAALQLQDDPPMLAWIGKANRSRRIVPGTAMLDLLADYLAEYARQLGRPLRPTDPMVCRGKTGYAIGQVSWGNPFLTSASVQVMVQRRGQLAGIGHISPHDLRRSAASILHRATDAAGGHKFDLLDIQKVLDHSDPATTMRSYLEPMQTGTKERAAQFLD